MSVIHVGTATTLAEIPTADISNNDVAYIWLNDYTRKMVFDATSTKAEDTTNHPYYVRPDDYDSESDPEGVWIEDVGADQPEAWAGSSIATGAIRSTNWSTTEGSEFDLDAGTIKIGGSTSPTFMVDGDGNVYIDVPDNSGGTSAGIIFKNGKRWLYDFNPADNGTVDPDGLNTFLGVEAGNLTMGSTATSTFHSSYNTGIGYRVLYSLTKGSWNVGMGYKVLYSNTEGNYNIGIGNQALEDNTTGSQNIAIGHYSLTKNLTGALNIAIGVYALQNETDGTNNIGIGEYALSTADGASENIGIGAYALTDLTDGEGNTAIGDHAGDAVTTGDNNSVLGIDSGTNITTGNNNVALGRLALGWTTTGSENVAIGLSAGMYQNDGSSQLNTPEYSVYIGSGSKSGSVPAGGEDAITNEIVIGYNAIGNGSNTVKLGNTSISALHCQVALTVDSDKRIKRDIEPCPLGLDFIEDLRPVAFRKKNPMDYPEEIRDQLSVRPEDDDRTYLGLIAQEVEHAVDGAAQVVRTDPRGKKAITYEHLLMPMINAIQELNAKIERLEETWKI